MASVALNHVDKVFSLASYVGINGARFEICYKFSAGGIKLITSLNRENAQRFGIIIFGTQFVCFRFPHWA